MADSSEQLVGVLFPLQGSDVTCEYSDQPPDTTPIGANVRAFEVISERGRGGSRCGLSKYINELVNGAVSAVQHLAVLVDPQDPALNGPASLTDPGPGAPYAPYILDPSTNDGVVVRNPGRWIPLHGSGRRPNKVTTQSDRIVITYTTGSVGDGTLFVGGGGSDSVDYTFEVNPLAPHTSPDEIKNMYVSPEARSALAAKVAAGEYGFTSTTTVPADGYTYSIPDSDFTGLF